MKKHSSSLLQDWFKSKSHKQVAFTSSVILIGILFIVAIVSILVKKGPSADVVTSPVGRLARLTNISNGQLGFTLNGSPKTKPSNSVNVRIKSLPKIVHARQGINNANQATGLAAATITVKTTGGADIVASPLAATATAGINATQIQSVFDSDDYRNKVNQTTADLKIKLKVPNYLSRTVTVSDPKSVVIATPLLAGNFVDTGDSADRIDLADAAKCGPNYLLPVTADNKACDVNLDGKIDLADSAIWGPNYLKTGSSE